MSLKLKNGKFRDFKSLFIAYDALSDDKRDNDIRDNIKTAMIVVGLNKLTKEEEREWLYDKNGGWFGVVKYIENNEEVK